MKIIFTLIIIFLSWVCTPAQVSQSIGTIPSADSIVVYHDVTINTTGLPAGFNRIASRGTVAGTGFSVLTDDPDTAPADSTITDVNMVPVFGGGASQPFSICQNASPQSINSLLTVSDANPGQTLTWTVQSAPANGTLTGFPTTASSGSNMTPAGLSYQPAANYSGSDVFVIQVSDGFDAATITINVTVTSPVANNSVSGSQTACVGNTPTQLTGSLPTGGNGSYTYFWESSTTSASSGFSAATGTNNTQNYQPGTISVPTWYRRTVTSGSCAADVSTTTVAISTTNTNTWTGASSFAWSNGANWSCGTIPTVTSDVIIPNVATQPFVDITNAVANTLTINSGANLQFSGTGQRLDIWGTVTVNGTFDALPGTVAFRSTSAQNIPAGPYTNIIINGTGAPAKTLDGPVSVESTLTLTTASIDLGAHNLTIGNLGSISGGSSASYIITGGAGKLIQQDIGTGGRSGAILFPVGSSATSYTPATLTNSGTSDEFSARVVNAVYPSYSGETPSGSALTSNVVNKTWFINEAVAGGSNVSLSLSWNGTDETAGFTRNNSQLSHFTNGGWDPGPAGAATGSNPYSRSRTGITTFSPFGVGSAGSPLPLQLLTFGGQLQGEAVQLKWTTASEDGIAGFDVERSHDGRDYTTIGNIAAKGERSNAYGFTDRELPTGSATLLYRLKVKEQSGAHEYSNTVAIRIGSVAGSMAVYPNPVSDDVLYLNTAGTKHSTLTITILDAASRKWSTGTVSVDALQKGIVPVSVKGLTPGIYLLQIADEKGPVQSVRFSRQ